VDDDPIADPTHRVVDLMYQTTGSVFVGTRSGTCCDPDGVFFSINVDSQQWALSSSIDVTNSAVFYASGSLSIQSNTWYTLTLSVVGRIVNAWVNQQQVR
jgi:hypothetical protein